MRARMRVVAVAATLGFGVCAAGLASSGTADAADPIVVGDCSTTVHGTPGQPLALRPAAVLSPVLNVVRAVPVVGPGLAGQVGDRVSAMGNIPLGTVPAADTRISGAQVAKAAVPKIQSAITTVPLIGGVLASIVTGVQSALTSGCGIVVDVANTAAAPVQDGTKAVADASQRATGGLGSGGGSGGTGGGTGTQKAGGGGSGGTGGDTGVPGANQSPLGGVLPGEEWSLYEPGLGDFARSPMDVYGSIPFARPGLFAPSPGVRYGGSVPGYTPQYGVLGDDKDPAASGDPDGVQAAGRAEALRTPQEQTIALPVLLAVLALSMVTAALVRTWVLRRAPAATL